MCNCNKKTSPAVNRATPQNITPQHFQAKARVTNSTGQPRPKPTLPSSAMAVISGETLQERCLALGDLLGLDGAVPEAVLLAAVDNQTYAKRLLESKDNPSQLFDLINNPPASLYTGVAGTHTNAQLIAKAGKALVRWGFSGFATVTPAQLQTREEACLACPNLTAPVHALQRFTAPAATSTKIGQRTGNKICSQCGCVIRNKIRLATETCPWEDAQHPGQNRWGEQLPSA